jgi:ribosomal protein S18 acetylase RimI-like enzyme
MNTEVRKTHPGDRMAVKALCNGARYRLPQMWQWEDQLTSDTFLVTECGGTVVGAIFAWSDESPVAWVRVAALDNGLNIDDWLAETLPFILIGLRRRGASALAWMDYGGWIGPHLEARDFEPLTDVMTMAKFDRNLPVESLAPIRLRPLSGADIPAVAAVDRAAFTPHWWQSESTLQDRATRATHFAVAELAGEIVGYAEGELCLPTAHLNRIAVHPDYQGRGIGAALLRDALRVFWQSAERVTLNTQSDNVNSQQLYRRFGFEMTGDFVTVWERQL